MIDGSSMVIGTISVVFRHVCIHFGARRRLRVFALSSGIRGHLQYIKFHMGAHVNPTLSCLPLPMLPFPTQETVCDSSIHTRLNSM